MCVHCSKWDHCRCAIVNRMSATFSRNFACRKCEENIGEAVEQEEKLCDEVETVREFICLSVWVSACGGCRASVITRTR